MSQGAYENNRKSESSWALIKIRFAFIGFLIKLQNIKIIQTRFNTFKPEFF